MEVMVFGLLALMAFVVLAVELGSDSRPVDDARHWWPGTRSEDAYPLHHT